MVETRHQWQEFRGALQARYGIETATLMTCVLTHDDPLNDCPERSQSALALAIAGLLIIVLGAGVLLVYMRRRRRDNGTSQSSGAAHLH
jgi:LPXTG-motif cell wall-anchored protein